MHAMRHKDNQAYNAGEVGLLDDQSVISSWGGVK